MNKPNFFIVGAAKSATTSLHHYLKQHPDIFMSEPKEPKYFCEHHFTQLKHSRDITDINFYNEIIKNQDEYLNLFSKTKKKIKGESSVYYLYFNDIPNLLHKFNHESKILIVLRNPVDRYVSHYTMMLRDGRADVESLNEAKDAFDRGVSLKDMGLYYHQVKRYIDLIGKENVKILLYEDIKNDIASVLEEICEFLNINSNYSFTTNTKHNFSGYPKNAFINKLVNTNNGYKHVIKTFLPLKIRQSIKQSLNKRNLNRYELNMKNRKYLVNFYKDDIKMLEKLLEKDLSYWYKID